MPEDERWEFDTRHWLIAENMLRHGESISWPSQEPDEFNGKIVVKTLRKTASGDVTFLVQDRELTKVLTVGTICL